MRSISFYINLEQSHVDFFPFLVSSAAQNPTCTWVANNGKASLETGLLDGEDVLRELKSVRRELRDLQPEAKSNHQTSDEWIQVSSVIDRLLFSTYIFFITVSFITIAIIWVKSCETA